MNENPLFSDTTIPLLDSNEGKQIFKKLCADCKVDPQVFTSLYAKYEVFEKISSYDSSALYEEFDEIIRGGKN